MTMQPTEKHISFMLSTLCKKYLYLPLPKDLGHGSNALQMRDIDPFIDPSEYCWEDWETEVRLRYPVRWFFNKTIPNLFSPIRRFWRTIKDSWYWVKCHTLESFRFHLIDIREDKSIPFAYRFGWTDADHKIMLANFAILKDFVEKEEPKSLRDFHSEEEIDQMGARSQQDAHDEVMTLYRWWMTERHVEKQIADDMFEKSKEAKTAVERSQHARDWSSARDRNKEREDEMLIRLIKVRHTMWT